MTGLRFGPGPVFEAECLTASRRVQFYSARVLLVFGLLAGMAVVWLTKGIPSAYVTTQELARIGSAFYTALMGFELSLALVVAPAAAAGAICQDRARGGLALLMTTGLTDSEIVLGRLASRLLSTFGVIACGLPVLALSTLLGGVDPVSVAGGTLVVVGVASLSVAMAMTFSLWAGKPHEALSATYAAWAVWLLAYLACESTMRWVPAWIERSNPFSLMFSSWFIPGGRLSQQAWFFAGCLAATAALAGLSTWMLRPVTLRRQGMTSKARERRPLGPSWLRRIGQAAPELDDDPILWREWHRRRPSGFGRAIWWTFAVLASLFTATALFVEWLAPGVVAFQVSIGLLLACVGATTSLAEERAQGGLDVVLATPIDSRAIVLGKWWGAFRIVPRLAILPGLLVLTKGLFRIAWPEAVAVALLVVGLVLAYGAAIAGLGLLIAIAQPRQGRAVALMVACYLVATVAYPAIGLPMIRGASDDFLPLWPSPFFGMFFPTNYVEIGGRGPMNMNYFLSFGFLGLVVLVAAVLLRVALGSFDRGLGRVVDRSRPVEPEPRIEEDAAPSLSA